MGRVEGKVALITGAARGQGRAHAVRLAEEGADIIAIDSCAQIDSVPYPMGTRTDLDQTAKEVEAFDRRVHIEQVDVRDSVGLQEAVARAAAELGPIDIVVANAGIFSCAPTAEMPAQMWQDMLDVNLTGVWNTVQAVVPAMLERGTGGSLILISSAAGIKGMVGLPHYVAAKHGVTGLMKSWSNEFGPSRIRVNSVHPSGVATTMIHNDSMFKLFRPDLENPGREDMAAVSFAYHSLPESWVQPRDIADAVLFLASDESKFITGQQLKVDLGFCEK